MQTTLLMEVSHLMFENGWHCRGGGGGGVVPGWRGSEWKKLTPLDQIVLLSRGQPRASHCGWAVAGGRRKNLQTVIHSKTDWVTRTTWVTWANRETWVSSVTRLTNDQGDQGYHADRSGQGGRDFWIDTLQSFQILYVLEYLFSFFFIIFEVITPSENIV